MRIYAHLTAKFQSTLPARGATEPESCGRCIRGYFNPRSPHGERRNADPLHPGDVEFQSTLPARGATRHGFQLPRTLAFQSTLPARGATNAFSNYWDSTRKFQSTLPARGATSTASDTAHASTHFNPRSPHGERRGAEVCPAPAADISIHAPRTGSDQSRQPPPEPPAISIHAPRTGSDTKTGARPEGGHHISIHAPRTGSDTRWILPSTPTPRYFNPRSPHGERRRFNPPDESRSRFQSTLPARGATPRRGRTRRRNGISIHAPRTGSDCAK